MSLKPKITVVTVCYNAADLIEKTILSVIGQTYPDIEYIVVDGASKDGTVDIIKKYGGRITRWISEPDKGLYDAMNKGISMATGDYINFMNAGDYFTTPDAIEKAFSNLKPETDILYGDSTAILPDGSKEFAPAIKNFARIARHPVYRHNASFTRTSLHKKYPFATDRTKEFGYALDYNNIFTLWHLGCKFQKVDVDIVTYLREGTSDHSISSVIYNFRIHNQFQSPGILDYLRLGTDILRVFRRDTVRKWRE